MANDIELRDTLGDTLSNGQSSRHRDGHRGESLAQVLPFPLEPASEPSYRRLGNDHLGQGRLAAAVVAYRQAIACDRTSAKAWANLGTAYLKLSQPSESPQPGGGEQDPQDEDVSQALKREALAAYRQGIALDPDLPGVAGILGRLLVSVPAENLPPQQVSPHWAEAIVWLERALGQDPTQEDSLVALAIAQTELSQFAAAEATARRAIATHPHSANAHFCLARALFYRRRCAESAAAYRRGLDLAQATVDSQTQANAWVGLATACFDLGDLEGAAAACEAALAIDPEFASARWARANIWLHQGDYRRGWPEFDWRWQAGVVADKPALTQPEWDGSRQAGKTLLVYAQCGLGDILQFARFLPAATALGLRVVTATDLAAIPLLALIPGVEARDRTAPLPEFDYHISFLSLPRFFVDAPETVLAPRCYLGVPAGAIDPAAIAPDLAPAALAEPNRPRHVGLVWASGTQHSLDGRRDQETRSCALAAIVGAIQAARGSSRWILHSLQVGAAGAELAQLLPLPSGLALRDWSPHLRNLGDTAAVCDRLDLIISVDTSVAHLAAALGKPTWLLLPWMPNWRWHLPSLGAEWAEATPWYPTMRLFRQTQTDDWTGALAKLTQALVTTVWPPEPFPATVPAALRATDVQSLVHQAEQAVAEDDRPRAERLYRQVVAICPHFFDALHNLGAIAQGQGRFEEAIEWYQRAIAADPQTPVSLRSRFDLAQCYTLDERYLNSPSEVCAAMLPPLQTALALSLCLKMENPPLEIPATWRLLSIALRESGQLAKSLAACEVAIAHSPDHCGYHYSGRGFALLGLGRLKEGWVEYDWRLQEAALADVMAACTVGNRPLWQGEDLEGKTLLVCEEQGFGDTLQFVRYLPLLAERAGRLVFMGRRSFFRLLQCLTGVSLLVEKGAPFEDFDYGVPLLSVPRWLGTNTIADIPAPRSYLSAPPAARAALVLDRSNQPLHIGLVWASGVHIESDRDLMREHYRKSMPLAELLAACDLPGVGLWSLQVGDTALELEQLRASADPLVAERAARVRPLGGRPGEANRLGDWADTAAACEQLDLILSIDTSVAHLAGALGRPVWILLPFAADWRWLEHREDTPWYPTARLFRQTQPGDWAGVGDRLRAALTEFVSRTSPRSSV